jgi:hypothetical protein
MCTPDTPKVEAPEPVKAPPAPPLPEKGPEAPEIRDTSDEKNQGISRLRNPLLLSKSTGSVGNRSGVSLPTG